MRHVQRMRSGGSVRRVERWKMRCTERDKYREVHRVRVSDKRRKRMIHVHREYDVAGTASGKKE